MFATVLVANRGEIAVRVTRTLRRLGIRSAAVYTDADAGARHVDGADVAVRVDSYLDVASVLDAARRAGAQAVHPGYGFLAENAAFARACCDAGLVFVGPPAAAVEAMGDKIRAKSTVQRAGVPVVPGRHDPGMSDDDLVEAAYAVGFPVLLKPSAGGGGKGMRRVADATELREAVAAARREARGAFGDDALLVERYVDRPRHVEVQVLADAHGNVVHLGERECSLQRRHQKVVEECPSPLLTPSMRESMGAAAVRVARSCGYVGAGTVEFLVPDNLPVRDARATGEFFFLEMNTRLQVEHGVTELVTGLDLVEEQLRVAAGERLRCAQEQVRLDGWAVEARVYAEDPARGFVPTGGRVLAYGEPGGEHVRVDAGIRAGDVVGSAYDPMLAKVLAWGEDRAAALRRLDAALARTVVLGVTTNVGFLRALLGDREVAAGHLDTGLVERRLDTLLPAGMPPGAAVAAALGRLAERDPGPGADPFAVPSGWRVGEHAETVERLRGEDGSVTEVRIQGRPGAALVREGDGQQLPAGASIDNTTLRLTVGGETQSWSYARDADTIWVGRAGGAWALREVPARARAADAAGPLSGNLLSPMPGTVTAVHVAAGNTVSAGSPVVAVEAMKMEYVVRAPADGTVTDVLVAVGQSVGRDAVLAVVRPRG